MVCKNCGNTAASENFCSQCGQKLQHDRIKLPKLLHEILHTYTHLEKGFLYVIRQLATHPGTMQRKYIDGMEAKYQKPFPMFVICGTICALVLYFTNKPYSSVHEQYFYKNYYVLLQAGMLPVYALLTWILFRSSKLYYAEILVLTVYMVGFMLLIIIPINVFHFRFNTAVISYIEMIALTGYNVWTNLNFFNDKAKWLVILKSILNILVSYLLFNSIAELLMDWFM
jgi:hypothetical protein